MKERANVPVGETWVPEDFPALAERLNCSPAELLWRLAEDLCAKPPSHLEIVKRAKKKPEKARPVSRTASKRPTGGKLHRFKVGDKVTLAPGCGGAFASVPKLVSMTRVYCVSATAEREHAMPGFMGESGPVQYIGLVGVRLDRRSHPHGEALWPACVFRPVHRTGDHPEQKEAA